MALKPIVVRAMRAILKDAGILIRRRHEIGDDGPHLIKSHFACRRADHARDRHRCRRARLSPGHGVGSARGLIAKSPVQGLIDGNRACRSGVTMVRS